MLRAVLVALLLAPIALAASVEEWRVVELVDKRSFEAFDAASMNAFDFDGDGWPEIVSSNDNGHVYVISAKSGRVMAKIETTHPEGWAARDINPVAIGDLYGDGRPCLVIPNSAAYLSAWCYDGRSLWGGMDFDKRWEIRVDAADWDPKFHDERPWLGDMQPSMDGNAFLADVDGSCDDRDPSRSSAQGACGVDGEPGMEIFVETDGYPGQFSFTHTGEYRWHTAWWDGNAGVVVADLDGDKRKEAIFASDSGMVACYDADKGTLKWTFDASKHGASPGSITLAPTIADLDGDGKKEIVFAARGATAGLDGSHATWFALRAGGGVLWQRSYDWMNPLAYSHPAAIDVNGDGKLDVVALDWNTIGHKPGNWEPTSRGPQLFALRGSDGGAIWHTSVPAYWSNKDFVIVGNEIIANAAQGGRDGLGVYDLRTGKPRGWSALPEGWEVARGPVALDTPEGIRLVVPLMKPDERHAREGLDVGGRRGALAIVAIGTGDVRFDANLLHSDRAVPWEARGVAAIADVGWIGAGILVAIGAAAALLVRMRGQGKKWGMSFHR